jgi:hypothetical protein
MSLFKSIIPLSPAKFEKNNCQYLQIPYCNIPKNEKNKILLGNTRKNTACDPSRPIVICVKLKNFCSRLFKNNFENLVNPPVNFSFKKKSKR